MGHLLLFSILPYLLPILLCAWPAQQVYSRTRNHDADADNDADRKQARTALYLFLSYALSYLPAAVTGAIVFPALLQ